MILFRWASIFLITTGSSILAMTLTAPPIDVTYGDGSIEELGKAGVHKLAERPGDLWSSLQ